MHIYIYTGSGHRVLDLGLHSGWSGLHRRFKDHRVHEHTRTRNDPRVALGAYLHSVVYIYIYTCMYMQRSALLRKSAGETG